MANYYDREFHRIPFDKWKALRRDSEYCTVRLYDNGSVKVFAKWLGMVENPNSTFPEYYPIFRLNVENYGSNGLLRYDPVEHGKMFKTENLVVAAYERFVERWTESYSDENGNFVEADNLLTPPPPPNPDAPDSDFSSVKGINIDDVGAW